MKTSIVYIILLLATVQFAYSQEEQRSADKFVAKCPNEIFIGAILEANSINQDTYKIWDAPINPITVSYTLPIKSQTITPGYSNMMNALHEALKTDDVLKSNYSFSFAIKEIKSYNELAVNWGQQINPEILLGVSPKYQTNKTILMVDITQSFFSIGMDLPESLSTDPKVLQQLDELIYINSIQFGRKITVAIESYSDYYELKESISNLLDHKPIDSKVQSMLANSTIRIMTVGGNNMEEMNPDTPFAYVLNYFSKEVTPDDFGTPISFSASHIKDNSVFVNKYDLQ
jgi:hypothetical protein